MDRTAAPAATATERGQRDLPVLQTDGFSAHVDACAWELAVPDCANPPAQPTAAANAVPGAPTQLWFVSLLGAQQAVKALWARLVKGERATLRFPVAAGLETVRFCVLARAGVQGPIGWRLFSASLPFSAGHHAILVPAIGLYGDDRPEFVLIPRQEDAAAGLHYRFLNRRVPLPLHPSWGDWLWERALRTGEAATLHTHGLAAYRCVPNVDALREDLSEAVRQRRLSVPGD